MWSQQTLKAFVRSQLKDYLFIVVSNREPYIHSFKKGKVECRKASGGLVTAIDPILKACEGLWVAAGSGDADQKASDPNGRIKVPVENPQYTLKRVWLDKREEDGYYYGYSNEALWPLSHMVFQRPTFLQQDWEYYKQVNQKFAKALLEEIGTRKAFVWIQDYHLSLLPKYLKDAAPGQLLLAHFWHIPWPCYEAFRICPQKKEILESLLSNDIMGFHIQYHCNNFLDSIDREMESKIDRERFSIVVKGHETMIRPYPISIDFDEFDAASKLPQTQSLVKQIKEDFSLEGKQVIVGVDRIDYTKGIPEKFQMIDRLLKHHPELKGKIVFLQLGIISRLHIASYKNLNEELNSLAEEINWEHSLDDWKPIIFLRRELDFMELVAFYNAGDICLVNSLHDGMNLVAKEFIASRSDESGVLVLSQFTGAARELTDAVHVNPYDFEQASEELFKAITMPLDEVHKRMERMRHHVAHRNIYYWAGKMIADLVKIPFEDMEDETRAEPLQKH